jgi:hypothetical protein
MIKSKNLVLIEFEKSTLPPELNKEKFEIVTLFRLPKSVSSEEILIVRLSKIELIDPEIEREPLYTDKLFKVKLEFRRKRTPECSKSQLEIELLLITNPISPEELEEFPIILLLLQSKLTLLDSIEIQLPLKGPIL